jgi:hypothetical protein
MKLRKLQYFNIIDGMKGLSFSIIFLIIAFVIFVGIIDRSILHLSFFEENPKISSLTKNIFLVIMITAVGTQSIFICKTYSNKLSLQGKSFQKFYLIPIICHFINLVLVSILITQISYESRYSKFLILFTIWINTSTGISILAVLAYRFLVWLKESTKKSLVVISYTISVITFIILNAAILLYFTLGYRVGLTYITSATDPSFIFSSPHTDLSILISVLAIISFISIWVSSLLLLNSGTERIKMKYILVIVCSLVIFFSQYAFLLGFNWLRSTNVIMFYDIYTVTTNIAFPLGAIFFGFTFWILAKNIMIPKDSSLEDKERFRKVTQTIYLTAIGIILLIFSASSLDITRLPYPPFGMVSFTFMNVGALSFLLGIYNLAVILGTSSHFRLSSTKKSDFLYSIGSSQRRLSTRKKVAGTLKAFRTHFHDTESNNEEIDYEYIKEVILAKKQSVNNVDRITFSRTQTPLGTPWEEWIERWCKWYYLNRISHDNADILCHKWVQEKETYLLCFLAKPLVEASKTRIECEITIPSGHLLFLPLLNNFINFYHYPSLTSEKELVDFAKRDIDNQKIVSISVNDIKINETIQFRIRSNVFAIVLPQSNDLSKQIQTRAISEGYWIFLHSLPSGKNKIYFKVETLIDKNDELNTNRLEHPKIVTEVLYNLNITN